MENMPIVESDCETRLNASAWGLAANLAILKSHLDGEQKNKVIKISKQTLDEIVFDLDLIGQHLEAVRGDKDIKKFFSKLREGKLRNRSKRKGNNDQS